MAIKLLNAFITKLQMVSDGSYNIIEDFNGTAAIISGSNLGGGSSYGLLAKLDASDASSYSGTGTTWFDLAGSNDGTLAAGSGTLTYSTSNGGYFDLSAGSGTKITLANSSDLQLSTSTTKAYTIWFNADAVGFSSFSRIILTKGLGSGLSSGFLMSINSSSQLVARVTAVNNDTTYSTNLILGPETVISTGTWYMATMIVKVSTEADTFKLFINDTEVGSKSTSPATLLDSDVTNLVIGNYENGLQNAMPFDGKIGEFYVHEGTFGATEVSTLFNNTKTRFGY